MSEQTRCEFCTGPIEYERRAEGQLGGCPHCGMMGIKIVNPAAGENFVSSEQYLRIAQTGTAYRDLRMFLRVAAWLNAALVVGLMAVLVRMHMRGLSLSFEWLMLWLIGAIWLLICDFFGYKFTVMWVDLVDTQITANRLKLYRDTK